MPSEDWKLKQLEEELRHEQAMRVLQGSRLDAHDSSLESIQIILERTERNIEALSVSQAKTDVMMQSLNAMMQDLIRALTADRTNGKGPDAR